MERGSVCQETMKDLWDPLSGKNAPKDRGREQVTHPSPWIDCSLKWFSPIDSYSGVWFCLKMWTVEAGI